MPAGSPSTNTSARWLGNVIDLAAQHHAEVAGVDFQGGFRKSFCRAAARGFGGIDFFTVERVVGRGGVRRKIAVAALVGRIGDPELVGLEQ